MKPGKFCKLVLSGLFFLVLAAPALAQFGGQPAGGKGGKGGFGGFSQDPEENFKNMSKGKDYILLSELNQFQRWGLEKYAKDNNIADGKITKDEYLKYSDELKKKFAAGGGFGGKPGGGFQFGKPSDPAGTPGKGGFPMFGKPGDTPGDPKVTKPGGPIVVKPGDAPGKPPEKAETPEEFEIRLDKEVENYFQQRDLNKDNLINLDEASGTLKKHFKEYDKNNDGLIDKTELKDYMRAYLKGDIGPKAAMNNNNKENKGGDSQKPGAAPSAMSDLTIDITELDQKPEVFTSTKLPAGLPAWFAQLDTDKDGQIGLYEWIAAGKKISEFEALDRNSDGFLTPDEVLFSMQLAKGSAKENTEANSDDEDNPSPAVTATPGSNTPAAPGANPKDKGKFGGFGGKKGGGFNKDKGSEKKN